MKDKGEETLIQNLRQNISHLRTRLGGENQKRDKVIEEKIFLSKEERKEVIGTKYRH